MIRPYIEMGAAMGWTPREVRAATLADFSAAIDGWLRANGAERDGLTGDEIETLAEMLER